MSAWIYAIISVVIISLVSIIGIFTIYIRKKYMNNLLLFMVSLSTGTLFGGAFLHLLPEAFEKLGIGIEVGIYLLAGILTFFILEKFIHWRHLSYSYIKISSTPICLYEPSRRWPS